MSPQADGTIQHRAKSLSSSVRDFAGRNADYYIAEFERIQGTKHYI